MLDRPSTKWVFQRHVFVDLKVILDRQPLQIGLGRLPDWLRNKHEVISRDTYNDNNCLFRCIAVHRGAERRFNTRTTRELAQNFSAAYPNFPFITLQHLHLLEKHFKQGIAAYSVTNECDFILKPRLTSWLVRPFMSFEAAQSSRTRSVFVFSKK